MNRSLRLFAVTVSAVMGLAWSAGAAAWSVWNPCETITGLDGWSGGSLANDRNSIPNKSLSSTDSIIFQPTSANPAYKAGQVVSTDFWTIPVPQTPSTVPGTVGDENAQFWVDSGGHWYTRSGAGDVDSGVVAPGTWCHVSVQLDYEKSKWSLYVNNALVVDNLSFKHVNTSPNNVFHSFKVESEGGVTVSLDDVLVANKVPNTLVIPLPAAVAATMNLDTMNLTFTPPVQVGVKYRALGGTNPDILTDTPILQSGTTIPVDMTGKNSYFFQIQSVSELDYTPLTTSADTYACYKQDRSGANRWCFSGVPVGFEAADLKVGGAAGTQLAQGLTAGNVSTGDRLILNGVVPVQFYLTVSGWVADGAFLDPAYDTSKNNPLPVGSGVVIRKYDNTGISKAILVGKLNRGAVSITLKSGWNYISRPFYTAALAGNCGFPPVDGDMFLVQRVSGDTVGTIQAKRVGGTWKKYNNLDLSPTEWPQGGEGFLYKNTSGIDQSYSPRE